MVGEADKIISAISRAVWGVPMLILLMGCGIYYTVRLGFFQILQSTMPLS